MEKNALEAVEFSLNLNTLKFLNHSDDFRGLHGQHHALSGIPTLGLSVTGNIHRAHHAVHHAHKV
jgi:hypothetical protein